MKETSSSTMKSGRRVIALVLVVGLVIGSAGVVAGLTMTSLSVEQVQLWESQSGDTDFNIQAYDTKVKGQDKIDVATELKNTDTSGAHEADVTVQLLNANGDIIANETQATGSVSGDGTVNLDYKFSDTNLAEKYDKTFIVVDQTA